MNRILFCILAAWMMVSCEPNITYEPNTNQDENVTGSLEDPVEKPEQEW